MDILRADGEQLLQDLPVGSADSKYETIHIKSSRTDYANTVFEDRTLDDAELRTFIDYSPSRSAMVSTKIVHLHYNPEFGIKSLSSMFRHIWHSFHLDPYMIHMFHCNIPGFFQLSPASSDNPLPNFYINRQAHCLFWTYDPSTLSTNAILLTRNSPGGRAAYPPLHAKLKRYTTLVGHPLFLALVTVLEAIDFTDTFIKAQHQHIGRTENHTGFSHFYINRPRPLVEDAETELNQLSNLSQMASSVVVGLADIAQHLQLSNTIIETIMNSSLAGGTQGINVMMKRDAEIKTIASVIGPQLQQRFGYLDYIKGRAENQLTVIFNLLARGDSQANIEISKAVMRDSTSMKTVAIMTMGFLPATFYAALFAVPSLTWDQPTVVGSRFWVYWAVTLPTTILAFIIWSGVMNRGIILGRIKERSKREKGKGEKMVLERFDTFA